MTRLEFITIQGSLEGAESLMIHAISSIDKLYEEQGYAKNHPDLVVAFMQVAVKDFTAAVQGKAIQELGDAIREAGARIAEALE